MGAKKSVKAAVVFPYCVCPTITVCPVRIAFVNGLREVTNFCGCKGSPLLLLLSHPSAVARQFRFHFRCRMANNHFQICYNCITQTSILTFCSCTKKLHQWFRKAQSKGCSLRFTLLTSLRHEDTDASQPFGLSRKIL